MKHYKVKSVPSSSVSSSDTGNPQHHFFSVQLVENMSITLTCSVSRGHVNWNLHAENMWLLCKCNISGLSSPAHYFFFSFNAVSSCHWSISMLHKQNWTTSSDWTWSRLYPLWRFHSCCVWKLWWSGPNKLPQTGEVTQINETCPSSEINLQWSCGLIGTFVSAVHIYRSKKSIKNTMLNINT